MQTELPSGSDPEYNQFSAAPTYSQPKPEQSNIEQYPLQFLINRIMENFSLNYKPADLIEVVRSLKTTDSVLQGILQNEMLTANEPNILQELARKAIQTPDIRPMETVVIASTVKNSQSNIFTPNSIFSPPQEKSEVATLPANDDGGKTPRNEHNYGNLKTDMLVANSNCESMEPGKEGSLNENSGEFTDSDESEETGSKNLLDKVLFFT